MFSAFIEFALLLASVAVCIPLVTLAIECCAALMPARRRAETLVRPARVSVLVPAHDEETVLGATLESITRQLSISDTLWVVADNCSDRTAEIARDHGAQVIERKNEQCRGKSFALACGLEAMTANPPDVVVFVDADCHVEPKAIENLAALANNMGRPVQGVYLISRPSIASPRDLISECAVTLKNLIRPLGLARLGLPCLLNGSGMACPWRIVNAAEFAKDSITEDMQWAVDLLLAGSEPMFCEEARVTSVLPAATDAAKQQRKRWEHGHLQILMTQVPRLTFNSIRQRRFALLAAALEIGIPPLSLLGFLSASALLVAVIVGGLLHFWLPAILLVACGSAAAIAVTVAISRLAPQPIAWKHLAAIPTYAMSKLPLYASFFSARQRNWVRTTRDILPRTKTLHSAARPVDVPTNR